MAKTQHSQGDCRLMPAPSWTTRPAWRLGPSPTPIFLCVGFFVTLLATRAAGFHEHFEGQTPSWKESGADARFRVIRHARTTSEARGGGSSEHLELATGNGSFVYFAHDVEPAYVIAELKPSLWVKSDRAGITMFVRIVLPRAKDQRTGQNMTVLLPGPGYTQVGAWQKLALAQIPDLLARHVRALRSEHGAQIDSRGAYLDQLVLNAYGGEGTTNLWIDDLEVAGEVGLKDIAVDRPQPPTERELADAQPWRGASSPTASQASPIPTRLDPSTHATSESFPSDKWGARPAAWNESASDSRSVQLQGTRLVLAGRAILPRMIEYQGEPLSFLRSLGFNMVWLREPASDEFLAEAASLNLWIVCPPPLPEAIDEGAISAKFQIVAAWNLGLERTGKDLQPVRDWAQRLHAKDPVAGRPTLVGCHDEVRAFSRVADVVIVGRNPIGTSMSMIEYGRYLAAQPRLARPGSPLWTQVPTEPDAALVAQWAAFSHALGEGNNPGEASVLADRGDLQANSSQPAGWNAIPPGAGVSPQQMRGMIYTALATGARGFLFRSRSPLDASDRETMRRRAMLELLNLELELIEPWGAGGSFVTSAPSGERNLFGVAMQTERARLLLPYRNAALDQFVAEPLGWHARAFTVPGVPDSNDAYELTPAGLRQITHKRVTGGIRVSQDPYAGGALVVMSSDPRVASDLSRQVARVAKRAAELKRELALTDLQNVESIERRLPASATPRDVGELLAAARAALEQSRALMSANDWRRSYEKSEMATVILGRLQRRRWQELVSRWPSVIASPLATSYAILPRHTQLVARLDSAIAEPNALDGGDIESLDWMLETGWRHFLHPQPGIGSDVELSPAAPHTGKFCLRLRAWSDETSAPPAPVETSPVWVTSAPVRVQAGDIVRVRGFVRVPQEPLGSADGVLVIDSLGGMPLAERIHAHKGWQEFTLFRAAAQTGEMSVTFALSGLGEAYIDDVTIEPLRFSAAGAGAPVSPPPTGAIPQTSRAGNLFAPPGIRR